MKNLIFIITTSLIVSCGISNKHDHYISPNKLDINKKEINTVSIEVEDKSYKIELSSLMNEYYFDDSLPIINHKLRNYQEKKVKSTSGTELIEWGKQLKRILKRAHTEYDSIAFSVPGKLIVLISKKKEIEELSPKPECAFSIPIEALDVDYETEFWIIRKECKEIKVTDSETYAKVTNSDYNSIKWTMEYPLNPVNNTKQTKEDYIFRSILKHKNSLIVIDYIPLKNSNSMITLIYPITGRPSYVHDSELKFAYRHNFTQQWDPIKEKSISYQQIQNTCDPVSFSLSYSNIKNNL